MCDFVSWIEHEEQVLFLTTDHLKDKKGRELKERIGSDINGHGAIREYYDIGQGVGTERECTDFSTPDNFPPVIVEAIKQGKMRGFGHPEGLLCALAWAEYEKVRDAARAEYEKVCAPARAEYVKLHDAAWAEYEKVRDAARAEYEKVCAPAFWDLFADKRNRAEAWK